MMKQVEKRCDSGVVMVQFAFEYVFGNVRRHRRVGPEQSEKIDSDPRHTIRAGCSGRIQGGRSKTEGRFLPKAHRIFPGRNRVTHSWQLGMAAFEQSNSPKKIERVRLFGQLFDQRIWRIPIRVGHRIISPRCLVRTTVSVKEFKETYFAKNCSSTAPRINTPVPSKAASSNVRVISKPRAKEIGPGAVTRRTTGFDLTVSSPSIWRSANRSFSSMYNVSNSRRPAAPSSPLAESTSVR